MTRAPSSAAEDGALGAGQQLRARVDREQVPRVLPRAGGHAVELVDEQRCLAAERVADRGSGGAHVGGTEARGLPQQPAVDLDGVRDRAALRDAERVAAIRGGTLAGDVVREHG